MPTPTRRPSVAVAACVAQLAGGAAAYAQQPNASYADAFDLPRRRVSTTLAFSPGHWARACDAHGDKRRPADLARWRCLARDGASQADRVVLVEQATVVADFRGPGDLEPIQMDWPCL